MHYIIVGLWLASVVAVITYGVQRHRAIEQKMMEDIMANNEGEDNEVI